MATYQVTSPIFFPGQVFITEEQADKEEPLKQPKLKKDGTEKQIVHNKKKGVKSEVNPIEIPDMKKLDKYFIENQMWEQYLIFVLSCNMARRIGDTLSLRWKHLFNPASGELRSDLLEIVEDKTDKLANPRINSACRSAILLYLEKTGVNPADNNYENFVFVQTSGNYKGSVITADGYRKGLKKAAAAVGIPYKVGTHSPRKTFGMVSRMLHPGDYDSMELLQTIFNHSDTKTTKHYIGLTKKKVDSYYDDMGAFYDEYISGDKVYQDIAEKPIVSLDANDLRELITMAYRSGVENANNTDPMAGVEALKEIMDLIDELRKG